MEEVPQSFSGRFTNFDPTSSVTFPMDVKFTEVPESEESRKIRQASLSYRFSEESGQKFTDPEEERRMMYQARLAYRLRSNLTRIFLNNGQSSSADSSDRKSGAATASSTPLLGGPRDPKELQLHEEHRVIKLTDVCAIYPMVGGGPGTLESHTNGFIYTGNTAASGFRMVFMDENVQECFVRPGDSKWPPLLLFHLRQPITVETKETKDIQFRLMAPTQVIHSEVSDDIRNKASSRNEDLKEFVQKVEDAHWGDGGSSGLRLGTPLHFDALEECEFLGTSPTGKSATFALTDSSLVALEEQPFLVILLDDIHIVNLALRQPERIDMTVVFKDLKRDVLEIRSVPSGFITSIKRTLGSAQVKYYVNSESRDWKTLVREIIESPETFIHDGGWESLGLEDSGTLAYYPEAYAQEQESDARSEKNRNQIF